MRQKYAKYTILTIKEIVFLCELLLCYKTIQTKCETQHLFLKKEFSKLANYELKLNFILKTKLSTLHFHDRFKLISVLGMLDISY